MATTPPLPQRNTRRSRGLRGQESLLLSSPPGGVVGSIATSPFGGLHPLPLSSCYLYRAITAPAINTCITASAVCTCTYSVKFQGCMSFEICTTSRTTCMCVSCIPSVHYNVLCVQYVYMRAHGSVHISTCIYLEVIHCVCCMAMFTQAPVLMLVMYFDSTVVWRQVRE